MSRDHRLALAGLARRSSRGVGDHEPVDPFGIDAHGAETTTTTPGLEEVRLRKRAGGNGRDATPAGVPRVARLAAAVELRAHGRMDPIGADQHVALAGGPVGDARGDPLTDLEVHERRARLDRPGALEEDRLQRRPVDADHRRAEGRHQPLESELPEPPSIGAAQVSALERMTRALDGLVEVDQPERTDGVGLKGETGAHGAQLRRSLDHEGLEADPAQRVRQGEPADARAGDHDLRGPHRGRRVPWFLPRLHAVLRRRAPLPRRRRRWPNDV